MEGCGHKWKDIPYNLHPLLHPSLTPMLKISITPQLITEKTNQKGECPVKLFIQCRYGRTKKSTGIFIKPQQWDPNKGVKKSNPLYRQLNQVIENQVNDIKRKVLEYELAGNELTITIIKALIHEQQVYFSIVEYAEKLCEDLTGKFSPETISYYRTEINRLKTFAGARVGFNDVNPAWLRKYENYLRGQNLSNNTIDKSWKVLKKFFNMARKDKVTTNYPFAQYDNPKYKQTDRTYLTFEEVKSIEEALKKPLHRSLVISANYFLLGAYTGLRYSDWARFDYNAVVEGERFIIRAKKNGKLISLLIHPLLRSVLERLKNLPPVHSEGTTNDNLKAIAQIAGINKKLTTHVARHSYAVRCLELRMSSETVAELMGITLKTVKHYSNITPTKRDEESMAWNKLAGV